jgi:hypothetical protein
LGINLLYLKMKNLDSKPGEWSKDKAEQSKQKLIEELKKEYGLSDDNLNWVDKILTELIQEEEDKLKKK